MKFGFDVDDTLINLREHAFHIYNRHLNKNVDLDAFRAIKTVEIHELFGLTREEGGRMWGSLMEEIYFTNCPPYPNALEVLQELDRQGHEIYYITARPKEHCGRTREWLIENGFPVQPGRFHCGMDDTEKVHLIRELGLDYYFDDKPTVLETLSDLPLQVYARDQLYNRHMNLPRLTSWEELRDIVSKL